jgi:hypothetical protein
MTGAQAGAKKKRIANGSDFAGMKSALIKMIECRADEQTIKTWPRLVAATFRFNSSMASIR